jgi:hypothetical protein
LDEPIPYEFTPLVGKYQVASDSVTLALIKAGRTDNHSDALVYDSSEVQTLLYLAFHGNTHWMDVRPKLVKDHNGMESHVPYILGHQYRELYNSIVHKGPSDWRNILGRILVDLADAIINRTAVHTWYLSLPANDSRCAENSKHEAFLTTFEKLRDAICRALSTDQLRLI